MKALFRFLAWLLGAIVVLGILFGIALKIFIDPNDYRDEISAAVTDATGRTLTIEGELSLAVLPCCGIRLGPLELGNPAGFEEQTFVRVEDAGVSVRILPMLLRQELVVGDVELDGLNLNLISLADGRTNWEFGEPPAAQTTAEPAEEEASAGTGLAGIDVAGVSITNGRILYRDDAVGDRIELSGLTLAAGAIKGSEAFPLEAALTVSGLAPDTVIDAALTATTELDIEAATADLSDMNLQVDVATPDMPGGSADLSIQIAGIADAGAERMRIDGLELALRAAGLKVNVTGAGEVVGSDPVMQGSFAVEPFAPRELLKTLGEPPMNTADPSVLADAAVNSDWSLAGDTAKLTGFTLKLDDTTATGELQVVSIEKESLRFDLQFDAIDLDRYTEPMPEELAGGSGSSAQSSADEPLDLPVEDIRALDLQGRLGFTELRVAEALLTNVDMSISADTGLVRLHPFTADIYGGKYSDDLRLNVRNDTPRIVLNSKLTGFQVGEFLADTEDYKDLTGTANLTLNAVATGNSEAALTRNLRGDTSFALEDGRYTGADIWYEFRKAKARIKGEQSPAPPAKPYTDISEFKGTAKIAQGIVRNNDFLARIPLMQLKGKGEIDIVQNLIDYRLEAKVTGEKTFEDGYKLDDLEGLRIPVNVSGDLEGPAISVDLATVVQDVAKKKAEKKLLEKLGIEDSDKSDGAEKSDDPKEQLKEGIRDLFR